MKKYLILAALALVAATACTKTDAPELSVTNASLKVDASGGKATFSVLSNTDWTVSFTKDTWYTLSATSGHGNGFVEITVEPYKDAGARSAAFTVEAGSLSQTVTLVQNAPAPPSEIASTEIRVPAMGGTFTADIPAGFNVTTNVYWPELLTVDKVEDGRITFTVASNPHAEKGIDAANHIYVYMSDGKTMLAQIDITQSWRNVEPGELLIEEVYFTGSPIEGSASPSTDQYIKLTNNSDHVIYADGVMFVTNYITGTITSVGAYLEYPELSDGLAVNNMYVIPGKGDEHPVAPGESLILALAAIDYTASYGDGETIIEGNPNAIDLSKADFEFYDENEIYPDTDNPDVENLEIWFKASATITSLHNRGFESYAIVIPPSGETAESILNNRHWTGTYYFHFREWNFDFDLAEEDVWVIPGEWVLDAVNCSLEDSFYQNPWPAAFDAGWTHAGEYDKDPDRFGKSVLRKSQGGKLVDTNNSTNDFTPNATPSLK
ncbi:MAG: DUF4876 domain-containing protein [Bacteroidales bacterium]|nr:DUF4876 domain-containing protein [Bacteroidales bacterium]